MNGGPVVRAHGLSKRFKMYSGPLARLADWLWLPPRPRYREFWALRDITFELSAGDCLGVIGPNGAGKSTLLKLLTGVLRPTAGCLETRGRVLSLLELGSDFNPELTGRQNADESMRLLGLRTGSVADRIAEVEAFAELGEFFDRPVKMYSSGMFVRLAFSLFSTMEPDVFLVDEALTVGDLRFSGKALARIRDMRERGTTLLFVSHNLEIINQLCTRVVWIHSGKVQLDGPPREVTAAYTQFMVHGAALPPDPTRVGAGQEPATSAPESRGVYLGDGWHPLEAYGGEVFRWAETIAELIVEASGVGRELLLEVEPGPSVQERPMPLFVDSGAGPPQEHAIDGRQVLRISVPPFPAGSQRLRLWSPGGEPVLGDGRQLAFRIFRWGWLGEPDLQPVQVLGRCEETTANPDLAYELRSMRAALASHRPVPAARTRVVRVVTRDSQDEETARCVTFDEIALEVTVEALADVPTLIVGMEIKDVFGRSLYRTRTDQQSEWAPQLAAGEQMVVRFCCSRLLLGYGLYTLTIGVAGAGLENEIWHLVERAWSFQVLNAVERPVFGVVDLDWRYMARAAVGPAAAVSG